MALRSLGLAKIHQVIALGVAGVVGEMPSRHVETASPGVTQGSTDLLVASGNSSYT